MQKYETLKQLVANMEADVQKFYNGNNAAGTRVRKHLQDVKKHVRICVTKSKKSEKAVKKHKANHRLVQTYNIN